MHRTIRRLATAALTISAVMAFAPDAGALPGSEDTTTRVSVATTGDQADSFSVSASISADGRYVAFRSTATNLIPSDTNGFGDIFVHDTVTGTTARVSVATDGTPGNSTSFNPDISTDGRYVAFDSLAANLVPGDTNGQFTDDVFVHDTLTGTTTRVSVATDGTEANDRSTEPSISADGRYVAFRSAATNLVAGDTNARDDVFVHDTLTGTTTRVSVDSAGGQAPNGGIEPAISADGRHVAFSSFAPNLVAGDTNGVRDVFVHDTDTGTTTRVSVDSAGTEGDGSSFSPVLSADGRRVTFESDATNLAANDTNNGSDVFVHDLDTGTTTRVSVATDGTQGDDEAFRPTISDDGRHVAFDANSSNLVAGDTNGIVDTFVHDTLTGTTTRVSVATDGTQGDLDSFSPAISADGRHIALTSTATTLVPGDTNERTDVFVRGVSVPVCGVVPATITGSGAITGTSGDDVIYGSAGPDTIDGLGGDDIICGGGGNDTIDAGPGDDLVFGEDGQDTIFGRLGNDTIFGGADFDTIDGNFDDDWIDGGPGPDVITGAFGFDRLFGGAGSDTIRGAEDDDLLDGGPGPDVLDGQAGNDRFWHSSSADTYIGGFDADVVDYSHSTSPVIVNTNFNPDDGPFGEGDQVVFSTENLIGSFFDDVLIGSDRANTISGLGGNDLILAEEGNDTIFGGPGDDRIDAGKDNDAIDGGTGTDDRCNGGPGTDFALGCETTFISPL